MRQITVGERWSLARPSRSNVHVRPGIRSNLLRDKGRNIGGPPLDLVRVVHIERRVVRTVGAAHPERAHTRKWPGIDLSIRRRAAPGYHLCCGRRGRSVPGRRRLRRNCAAAMMSSTSPYKPSRNPGLSLPPRNFPSRALRAAPRPRDRARASARRARVPCPRPRAPRRSPVTSPA